jgi:hypothetical protein
MEINYESVTDAAARTLEMLTIQSFGHLSEGCQLWWAMGIGAIRMWEEVVGYDAQTSDRARLQSLLDSMPHEDDEGSGNWRPTRIIRC